MCDETCPRQFGYALDSKHPSLVLDDSGVHITQDASRNSLAITQCKITIRRMIHRVKPFD